MNKPNAFKICDTPINDESEDKLYVARRYVEPIFNLINAGAVMPLTIAVTGEWGCGKTSVINLLRNKLNTEHYSIIDFDPIIEGKLEIIDLLKLFCLKLCAIHKKREIIKKCAEILAAIMDVEISAPVPIPLGIFGAKYNPGKVIKQINDICHNNKEKFVIDQLKELNEYLKNNSIKICIIIDEIDRLTASNIVNFLIFTRVLETLNNLICVVGLDYERIITKLINENYLGLSDYRDATAYVDKLFQLKYQIVLNESDKIAFTQTYIRELDKDNILRDLCDRPTNLKDTSGNEAQQDLTEIVSYLCTPRQIKKWLISIYSMYNQLGAFPDKIALLKYLAIEIKHPVINQYFAKHTLIFKTKYNNDITKYIKGELDITINKQKENRNCIILAITGIKPHDAISIPKCKEILEKITSNPISDRKAEEFLIPFIDETPSCLLEYFIERRYYSENKSDLLLYKDFFERDPNRVLTVITERTDQSPYLFLANDIVQTLSKNIFPKEEFLEKISPKLLNKLLCLPISQNHFNSFGHPYYHMAMFLIHNIPLEIAIKESWCNISEQAIHYILAKCGIKNKEGLYNLDDFRPPEDYTIQESRLNYCKFKGINIASFKRGTIEEILREWIKHTEDKLSRGDEELFLNEEVISVFYRYIQWQKALDNNMGEIEQQKKLVNFIEKYLQSKDIDRSEKRDFLSILDKASHMYLKPLGGHRNDKLENPLNYLFNKNIRLLNMLLQLTKDDDEMKHLHKLCEESLRANEFNS